MRRIRTFVFLLALGAGGVSAATDVTVTLKTHGSLTLHEDRILQLVCGNGTKALVFDLGSDRRISVPNDAGPLECRVDEKDIWSRSVHGVTTEGGSFLTIDLWPAAEVRGQIVEPETPGDVSMRVSVTGSIDGSIEHLGSRDCPIGADGSFGCPVPAARTLDAKIRLTGHISLFLWAQNTLNDVNLGATRFRPGASVIGRVDALGACGHSQSSIVVRMMPLSSGWKSSKQEERLKRQAASVETDQRGFFHFDGIEAGKYSISAEKEGCGLAQMSPVTVYPRAETRLREKLVLTPPSELEVVVEPPVDPWGRPWQAKLFQITPLSGARNFLSGLQVSRAGVVRFSGLPRGPFRVSIMDSGGSSWALRPVEVVTPLERVEIALDLVEITGTVLSGDDEIEANLVFGGRHGSVSIRAYSGAEGRFEAILPREGEWQVDVLGVDVPIIRRLSKIEVYDGADVTLQIGDRSVSGSVVDEEGSAFPGASITVEIADEPGNLVQTISDEDGSFELHGFDRKKVVVSADQDALSSDEKMCDLTTKDAEGVELVLKDRGYFILNVVRGGRPVLGARAQYVLTKTAGIQMRGYTGDLNGRIEIPLKPGQDGGSVVVIAQGAPVQLISVDRDRSPVTVSLDGIGGSLTIPRTTYPYLKSQGGMCPLPLFLQWSNVMQVHQTEDLLTIAPMAAGYYEACTGIAVNAVCKGATLQDGVAITLD